MGVWSSERRRRCTGRGPVLARARRREHVRRVERDVPVQPRLPPVPRRAPALVRHRPRRRRTAHPSARSRHRTARPGRRARRCRRPLRSFRHRPSRRGRRGGAGDRHDGAVAGRRRRSPHPRDGRSSADVRQHRSRSAHAPCRDARGGGEPAGRHRPRSRSLPRRRRRSGRHDGITARPVRPVRPNRVRRRGGPSHRVDHRDRSRSGRGAPTARSPATRAAVPRCARSRSGVRQRDGGLPRGAQPARQRDPPQPLAGRRACGCHRDARTERRGRADRPR